MVLSDDEPQPEPQFEARRLSLEPARDPRSGRVPGRKHPRDADEMSVGSASNPKKPDQLSSGEKRK